MFTSSRKHRTFVIAVSTAVAVSAAPAVAEADAASAQSSGAQISASIGREGSSSNLDAVEILGAAREFARDQASAIASGNPAVEGLLHDAIDNIVGRIAPGLLEEQAKELPETTETTQPEPSLPTTPEERGGKPIFQISW